MMPIPSPSFQNPISTISNLFFQPNAPIVSGTQKDLVIQAIEQTADTAWQDAINQERNPTERQEQELGRALFYQFPITVVLPKDLLDQGLRRFSDEDPIQLSSSQIHALGKASESFTKFILRSQLSGLIPETNLAAQVVMVDLCKMVTAKAMQGMICDPSTTISTIVPGRFSDNHHSAKKEALQQLVPYLRSITQPSQTRSQLHAQESLMKKKLLRGAPSYSHYLSHPDLVVQDLACTARVCSYIGDFQGELLAIQDIEKFLEQKQNLAIQESERIAKELIEEENHSKKKIKQPAQKQSKERSSTSTVSKSLELQTAPSPSQAASSSQKKERGPVPAPSSDTRGFRLVSTPSSSHKQKTLIQTEKEQFYKQSDRSSPCVLPHRILRWQQLKEVTAVREFEDPAPENTRIKRYENGSKTQCLEQIKRHFFPGLERLANDPDFQRNYGKCIEGTWIFKVLRENQRGEIIMPLTLMTVCLSKDNVLYHAFAHPTSEIQSLDWKLGSYDLIQQDIASQPIPMTETASSTTPVSPTLHSHPIQYLTPIREGGLPRIRLTTQHPLSTPQNDIGFAVFYPLFQRAPI